MYYEFSQAIPANTTEANAVTQKLKLTAGIVHRVEFEFPAGCNSLVHARIRQGASPIWPRNNSSNIAGNFFPVAFNEYLELKAGGNELQLYAWNEDTQLAHTIRVRVALLKVGELFPEVELGELIKLFFRSFRRR